MDPSFEADHSQTATLFDIDQIKVDRLHLVVGGTQEDRSCVVRHVAEHLPGKPHSMIMMINNVWAPFPDGPTKKEHDEDLANAYIGALNIGERIKHFKTRASFIVDEVPPLSYRATWTALSSICRMARHCCVTLLLVAPRFQDLPKWLHGSIDYLYCLDDITRTADDAKLGRFLDESDAAPQPMVLTTPTRTVVNVMDMTLPFKPSPGQTLGIAS